MSFKKLKLVLQLLPNFTREKAKRENLEKLIKKQVRKMDRKKLRFYFEGLFRRDPMSPTERMEK